MYHGKEDRWKKNQLLVRRVQYDGIFGVVRGVAAVAAVTGGPVAIKLRCVLPTSGNAHPAGSGTRRFVSGNSRR